MATNKLALSYRTAVRGSDRGFGLIFVALFVMIGLAPLWNHGFPRLWALSVAAAFAGVAFFAPALLRPLNALWFKLGLLLHHIINPLIMGLMFFGAFTPMALVLRWMGKDLLRLKREPDRDSYWIIREPPGPKPGSMSKQF